MRKHRLELDKMRKANKRQKARKQAPVPVTTVPVSSVTVPQVHGLDTGGIETASETFTTTPSSRVNENLKVAQVSFIMYFAVNLSNRPRHYILTLIGSLLVVQF